MHISISQSWTRRAVVFLAVATLMGSNFAQQAAPVTKSLEDETIELSPFVVRVDKDNGYQATTTLAGTRLRNDLKDVGASISIITREFLQDTGATDTKSLLSYVTGSEVGGPMGNILGGALSVGTAPATESLAAQTATRLRALAAGSEARDFYATGIPFDGYNIERVEVNRGANAILFGTGSPAGIINTSLKQARMKNAYSVEARYGSYDSYRGSVDLNQQIVKGELAFRINALKKHQKYQQDYAFENDERLFLAYVYDPKWARTKNRVLSGTVIRGNVETGNLDSRRPRVLPPSDRISSWFRPLGEGYPARLTWDQANQRTTQRPRGVSTTGPIFRNPSVFFDDPTSAIPGTGSFINGAEIVGRQGAMSNMPAGVFPAGTGFFATPADINTAAIETGIKDSTFYVFPSLTDSSVFDYRHKLLEGPNRMEYGNFDTFNVVVEQRFFADRAGFELAFDKQTFSQGSSSIVLGNTITVDINTTLLDGTINPNFGRPMTTGQWRTNYAMDQSKTGRATAYYKLHSVDLVSPRWAKWLGGVTFTGLVEEAEKKSKALSGNRYAPGSEYIYGTSNLITDADGGNVGILSYLGPSLATATTASGANLQGLTALQVPTATTGMPFQFRGQTVGSQFVSMPLSFIDDGLIPTQLATGAIKNRVDTRSRAGIIQYKLLHDTLVLTQGWRRDGVDSFTAVSPTRGVRNNLIVNDDAWKLPLMPNSSVSDETQSRSVVFHVPAKVVRKLPVISGLSLRYNTSENFSPGGARYDLTGQTLASPKGTTEDIGFSLGLAKNRVVLTATWFETKQTNISAGSIATLGQSVVDRWRLIVNMTGLGLNPNFAQVQAPPKSLLDLYTFTVVNNTAAYTARSDVVLTTDAVSKGAEFEAHMNLTPNWRLTANASHQKAVRSNTGSTFRDMFFESGANGQSLYENWTGPIGQQTLVSEGGGRLSNSIAAVVNAFNTVALQDGGPAQELRKWRANLVTTYSFSRQSRLKGISIGGGGRWQDKVAIGFRYIDGPGGIRIPDVSNPYYGPTEFMMDSWIRYQRRVFGRVNLTVQLNVSNLLNENALIPLQVQPDGSIATYRMPSNRRYELSTRFDF